MTNFWEQLESKQLNQETIKQTLIKKLGEPNNQLSFNCLTELTKKINSYYQEDQATKNYTVYSLVGSLTSPEQIIEKKFKEGKRMSQTYYVLKVGSEKLQALQENLPSDKWQQLKNMAILGQNLVFKYKKWITNKQLLDFHKH